MDWHDFWDTFAKDAGALNFCEQVGRTANGGVPTPDAELDDVVQQVCDGLQLDRADVLLDLCCGNGLLTRRLAERCASVAGVDFSPAMLAVAREHHRADNIRYVQGSVVELPGLRLGGVPFTKIVMFESLAYFDPDQLAAMLAGIAAVSSPGAIAYFSGVLDHERIWSFFNSPERRASYEQQKREGREVMGRWWRRTQIEAAADAVGFSSEFLAQDPTLNTAHYRFDARLVAP